MLLESQSSFLAKSDNLKCCLQVCPVMQLHGETKSTKDEDEVDEDGDRFNRFRPLSTVQYHIMAF